MPQPEIESLVATSGEPQIKSAMSACIANEVRAGKSQEQAVAMCHSMISEKIGRKLES